MGDYIQIHANGLLKPLEMTKNHMMFVQDQDDKTISIPASGAPLKYGGTIYHKYHVL